MNDYDQSYYQTHTDHYISDHLNHIKSFAWIKSQIPAISNQKILDAGCGTGYLLNFIAPTDALCFGIDISDFAIKTARQRFPKCDFRKSSLTKLPFKSNYFDIIVCFNVIEHVNNQKQALREMKRVLKKGGILIAGTNIRNSLSWLLFKLFFGGDPTHTHEFTVSEFIDFIQTELEITKHTRSSCIARFHPSVNRLLQTLLKGDILIKAMNK